MKNFCVLFAWASLAASVAAQTSAGQTNNQNSTPAELPSAPSAVAIPRESAPPAKPATTTGASNPKPEAATKPVLRSLRDNPSPQSDNPSTHDSLTPPPDQPAATAPGPAPSTGASTGKDAGDDENFRITRKVDEVNVTFTVTDKHGHFIKGLTRDGFSVLDDKRPPEAIRGFSADTNLPLRVGLLIDASNSVRDRFKFEQEAAIEFLSQIVRPKADRAFVLGFDTTPEVTQDFTSSTENLAKGIRMIRPGGGTALFDALYYACRDKLMKQKESQPVRRAIILLSDGDDNQSRVTREEAIEMAQRAEVVVYTISTNLAPNKDRGDKVMERIADATGGRSFFPFKIQDVSNAFTDIQEELRSQYAIAYKPADFVGDGHYRSINIMAQNKKFHVRSRKGYFAPKQ